jgi:heat shock protein HslJ
MCVVALSGSLVGACRGTGEQAPPPPASQEAGAPAATPPAAAAAAAEVATGLADTQWRLVEIQSMDDAQGTAKANDPSLYTMRLNRDGSVSMRLNCNRATGTWKAEPSADPASGRFEFGPLAGTRALCPPPSLDERVTSDARYVRSYLLKDGRLHLSLMADGGIHVWEPMKDVAFEATADAALEGAIRKASPSYTKAVVDAGGGTGRARYAYNRIDLNNDGREEVLVYLLGSVFCGTGGCNLLLFTRAETGYTLVNDLPISRTPVIVSTETTGGWSDIVKLESGGGTSASYVRYTFDGTRYVERERLAATAPPAGIRYLAGDLTFDKGIPLEPGDTPAVARGPEAPAPSATGFSTVCGVTVGGRDHRYRCTVEGVATGQPGDTVLHFPDNTVTITWLAGGRATARFEGMVPKPITVSTVSGVTTFPFEDKTYFYASDRATAAAQLKTRR